MQELIPLDVHYRRKRGEMPRPEDYRGRFPDLGAQWLAGAVEASQAQADEPKNNLQTGPWKVALYTPQA